MAVDGLDGSFIQDIDLEADFGWTSTQSTVRWWPTFNNDGTLEVFAAGGHAEYPAIENNYGAAYMISWGEGQGSWTMFQHDSGAQPVFATTACYRKKSP